VRIRSGHSGIMGCVLEVRSRSAEGSRCTYKILRAAGIKLSSMTSELMGA